MPGVDLNYFMRQASKLSEKLEQRKKELAEMTVEGQAGEVRTIHISPEVVSAGDVAMMEDLVAAAVNAALTQARELSEKELGKISGGLKIPGLT